MSFGSLVPFRTWQRNWQLKEELVEKLKKHFFSVIIDETTDITIESQLAVMVQFWNESDLEVNVLDFITFTDATSDGLSNAVLRLLDDLGIRHK